MRINLVSNSLYSSQNVFIQFCTDNFRFAVLWPIFNQAKLVESKESHVVPNVFFKWEPNFTVIYFLLNSKPTSESWKNVVIESGKQVKELLSCLICDVISFLFKLWTDCD